MGSPWAFCIVHAVQGDEGTLVVAAYWVNAVKSALTATEFWSAVGELKACWGEGKEFDKTIVPFDYWKGARARER